MNQTSFLYLSRLKDFSIFLKRMLKVTKSVFQVSCFFGASFWWYWSLKKKCEDTEAFEGCIAYYENIKAVKWYYEDIEAQRGYCDYIVAFYC